ncbi:hypothetical protein VIN01S_27690 [Vibrio inusitatus NBRC 102082]|uniref:YHS domain-containing protein n=1 Tax=Vibrio inusitatus NBRC 102082 TaxID=1219070 RepID=A0A4Y3HY56_9VIBR|nr:YHS domain-containing (seleno)protein [Vibrio inusitatus]GEA51965.1 hypothetical protein VIN01S_27690 [Vibrio inusitatus NBRC 102082]
MVKSMIRLMGVLVVALMLTRPALAIEPVYSDFFGKAIGGYDSVAYFTEGKPVEGSKQFKHQWNDATWYFSSDENRAAFIENPEKYAPQYGGYCAWAVSQGYTAKIDPNAWYIYEGKLYLNYNKSIQAKWQKDIPNNVTKAEANWPSLLAN